MQPKLETVTKLVVTITPRTRPNAVLHPSTPTIPPLMQTYSDTFDAWQIATTATTNIYNVAITFWGKSGAFFVDNQSDYGAARRVYHAETSATLAARGDAFANREATRARRKQARPARHD